MARDPILKEIFEQQEQEKLGQQDVREKNYGKQLMFLSFTWPQQLRQNGGDVIGFSFRQRPDDWLMVIRIEQQGIRQVGFISGVDPIDCVGKAAKKLAGDTMGFSVDRYA